MNPNPNSPIKTGNILKFILISALGLFLFIAPIPTEDAFNIPLGLVVSYIEDVLFQFDGFNLSTILLIIFCTVSALGTVAASLFKVNFKNETLQGVFKISPLYVISRILALIFVWLIFFNIGPMFIISGDTGGLMQSITAHILIIFIPLAFAIPILTDFGIMEFIGILIRKVIHFLFTLPGRASVDLLASWFGSSSVSVLLTANQHERGYYSDREAAVICTNFAFVSLPFSFVIANFAGIIHHFLLWYLIICIACIIIAMITPRIWPLRSLSNLYVENVGKQINEEAEEGISTFKLALIRATAQAEKTTIIDVLKTGLKMYINVFLDLLPIILAWGTLSVAIFEFTPIFQFISAPLGFYMQLFGIEGAMNYAPAALIGFLDMFLPSVLFSDVTPMATRLIISALSIVQIIYMTETGVLIIKSKIPLNLPKLFVIFLIRTLLAIPILVFLVNLIF